VRWLEKHWYRSSRIHFILFPISLLYRLLVAFRHDLYSSGFLGSHQLLLPVIVVGNISVGGTGKTPLTLGLAQQLIALGFHPLILSRGYKRATPRPQQVEPHMAAKNVGDEPLLMAQRKLCPVWVGQDRVKTAHAALAANPQCDVVLCDDGLQHYRLRRDVEIAVIDGIRGFGNGCLLPAGPLREPVSRLKTVDAVVVNGGTADAGQFMMRLEGTVFYRLNEPGQTATSTSFKGKRIQAVAGIGHPQRFFQQLKTMGITCTPHEFPDHHPYTANDLAFVDCDAILMTEKDAVKCGTFADDRYWVLRVDAQIDSTLTEHILRKIESNGSKIT